MLLKNLFNGDKFALSSIFKNRNLVKPCKIAGFQFSALKIFISWKPIIFRCGIHEAQSFLYWYIWQGGKGAGFRAGSEDDTYDSEGKRMFHVRGSSDMNAKAMQVNHVMNGNFVVLFSITGSVEPDPNLYFR